MDRRAFLLSIGGLPMLAGAAPALTRICPLCGGKLLTVGSFKDDRSKPSLNIEVWNRASDEIPQFVADDPMCSRCFHAFRGRDQTWVRASEIANSFLRPLSPAILGFPLPDKGFVRSLIVYQQAFAGRSGEEMYSDGVGYWYATSAPRLSGDIRGYAQRLHLFARYYSVPSMHGQKYVNATYSAGKYPQ